MGTIRVRPYPPSATKRNRIEHRLFCHISQNWRGRPPADRLAVVELIGATTTQAGLKVECAIDPTSCQKGVKSATTSSRPSNSSETIFIPNGTTQSYAAPTSSSAMGEASAQVFLV